MGVSVAYARILKLCAQLPSMKEKTARYFTSCNLANLTDDKVCSEPMETFGIDEIPWSIDEN